METANAIKATLLFPLLDNDGDPFDRETWSWFQDQLVGLSDLGFDFTELGRTEGSWRGHTDRCRWIVTVVGSEVQVEEIRGFLPCTEGYVATVRGSAGDGAGCRARGEREPQPEAAGERARDDLQQA